MIARFRPTYDYSNLINCLFENNKASEDKLRRKMEDIYHTKNIFFFNHGRSAIYYFLKLLDVKGGVLSPAYNCIVVPDAIRFAGYENHFVDISLDDYNMNESSLKKAIKKNSKILMATHQFGIPCDMDKMSYFSKKYDLLLFEDSAAAMGAKFKDKVVGRFGKAAVVSFQDTKLISGIEGACLIVNDSKYAEKIKRSLADLRGNQHNFDYLKKSAIYKSATLPFAYDTIFKMWTKKAGAYTTAEKSEKKLPQDYVSRISKFSLGLINTQMGDMKNNIKNRNAVANYYFKHLKSENKIQLPNISKHVTPVWTRFPIRIENKKLFFEKMVKEGVDLAWTFSYSCAQEYKSTVTAKNSLIAAKTVLDLPIYPGLSNGELSKIVKAVKNSL